MVSSEHASAPAGDFIGLDIGGTKTQGILVREGKVIAQAKVGSANVQNVSEETAKENLADLFTQLASHSAAASNTVGRVIAGSGGIDTPQDAENLAALIRVHTPEANIEVVHDSVLILAAGKTSVGVAMIVGTGSAAWGKNTHGATARAGGWGYLLGDEGSAYWMGREAVRHALRDHDRGIPADDLTEALLQDVGLRKPTQLIAAFHDPEQGRHYWAERAKLVFDSASRGNAHASALIAQAAQDIASLIQQVDAQLDHPGKVVLGGGMIMRQPSLQEAVRAELATHHIQDAHILDQEPVFGTLYLAGIELQ